MSLGGEIHEFGRRLPEPTLMKNLLGKLLTLNPFQRGC